jgi:signal transduction histidine kinase
MAHEINNPLGIIVQAAQNILRRLDPSMGANGEAAGLHGLDLRDVAGFLEERNIFRYLQGIREAGERAAAIVADMLSFSRRSERTFSSNDLNAIVSKSLDLAGKDFDLKKHYDFRKVNVVREYDADLPPVPCVSTEIEQVLLNLVRNAAQAMARAGTEGPTLTLRTRKMQDWAVIEVEDNGPGIPRDDLPRIFDPFYTTKKAGEGTGLGLSVSYFIITNNHHGQLSVTSREGRGARFVVSLPLRQEA